MYVFIVEENYLDLSYHVIKFFLFFCSELC